MPSLAPLTGLRSIRSFQLTFACHGKQFVASVYARNTEAAKEEALIELAAQCYDFAPSNARLISAIQTA